MENGGIFIIEDVKERLTSPEITSVLAGSMFDPTPERVSEKVTKYKNDLCVRAFGLFIDKKVVGAAAAKESVGEIIILSIAVVENYRRRGIGKALIRHIASLYPQKAVYAETDGDAVGFYRSCGFTIESLGEKYPGVERFWCVLKY